MKHYILLRDNEERGPYSLQELKEQLLVSNDLVWIEGESTRWSYAKEVEELNPFITQSPQAKRLLSNPVDLTHRTTFVAIPKEISDGTSSLQYSFCNNPALKIADNTRSAPMEKFRFEPKKERASALIIIALLLFLIGSVFIVKSVIDDRAAKSNVEATLTAQSLPEDETNDESKDAAYGHALKTENTQANRIIKAEDVSGETLKELEQMISLTENNDKPGWLQQSKDYEIKIHNNSQSHSIQKLDLLIEYLKPGGQVAHKETFSIFSVAPNKTKLLVIPAAKNRYKIRYRLTGFESANPKKTYTQV